MDLRGELKARAPMRAAAGSFVGGMMEWYDFIIYGTAATLAVKLLLPAANPAAGTMLALATFGLAFVARPLGGVLFGYVGDRYGRRPTLLATLALMGASTVAIGLLPTSATLAGWSIGLLVVLRLSQGLAIGGELGAAAALAVESAPPARRGLFGAFAISGACAGTALGSGVSALVLLLPPGDFAAWGWRVPFLLGAVVVVVGIRVRRGVAEPDIFVVARRERPRHERPPLVEVLRRYRSRVALVAAVYSAGIVSFYLVTVYSLAYAKANLAVPVASRILTAVMVATLLNVVMTLVWGALSDRIGRRPVVVTGSVMQAVCVFGFFAVLPSGDPGPIIAATVATLCLGQAAIVGVAPAYFAEMFPTRLRVTGISTGIGIAAIVGGATPLAASTAVGVGDAWVIIALVCAALCAIAGIAVLATDRGNLALSSLLSDGAAEEIDASASTGRIGLDSTQESQTP